MVIEEKIVVGMGTDWPLDGLLTLPAMSDAANVANPVPAVVLVQGSGSHDMDEKIYKIRPFKDIAEGLAARGVAAIRYNKRTYSHGRQMVRQNKQAMRGKGGRILTVQEEVIEDAVLAADLLKEDPRINPEQVYIVGHSLGGMLAPRIDAYRAGVGDSGTDGTDSILGDSGGNFAGLIILAGSPRKLADIMKQQQAKYVENAKGIIKWIVKMQVERYASKLSNLSELSDEEAKVKPFAGGTTLYYLKDMDRWPVEDYLQNSTKPILIMQGEKDVQVLVEQDFNRYKELLAGNPNASFKLYEGLNHAFMPSITDGINNALKEFKVARPVEDYVIADMADWILEQAGA